MAHTVALLPRSEDGHVLDLVKLLAQTQADLEKALGPGTDAVIDSLGRAHLLGNAQTALRQSEERFRTLFEKDTGVFFLMNPDGAILYQSPSIVSVLGYTPDELVGTDFFARIREDGREEARKVFSQIIASPDKSFPLTQRFVHKDGQFRWLEGTGTNLMNEPGIRAIVFGLRDATERIKTETALRESEQWLTAIFEHAAVGIAEFNLDTGLFVRVNQRFCALLGYTREEFKMLSFQDITHPLELPQDMEKAAQLRAGTIREFSRAKRYLRKDKTIVWANVAISSIGAVGERPSTIVAVAQDITDSKRIEEHFLQAQKMEALGQFSGGVAHDFNNILTAIMGYSELALFALKENPVVRSHIGSVLKAGKRATDLVRQILTFSRQEIQARKSIPLQPVVEESVKLLRATIPSSIEIKTSCDPTAPTVLADANQVHQILTNLGINAWHALKNTTGQIEIKLEKYVVDEAHAARQPRLQPGNYARVCVRDNGCGMDPATLKRIFEPFFTTKAPGEGTGLGLSVVHGIMENHDGAVTVHSTPGEGSQFDLYFPAQAGETIVHEINEGAIPRGAGERILVVDDEHLLAVLIQSTLTELGYAAEISVEPAKALAMVRADPGHFALVITDQTMPVMTGLSLATQIHRTNPTLPILLMTGYSPSVTTERVDAAGVRDVVLKPVTVRSLGEAVAAALNGKPYKDPCANPPYPRY